MNPSGGNDRPSIDDVAARAGVSRATVSRVVNKQASVGQAMRSKVLTAIDELGYVPNAAARSLMTSRMNAIALVASEPDTRVFSDPYFGAVIRGVSLEANLAGIQLVLLMAQGLDDLARVKSFLSRTPLDGAMLISGHEQDGLSAELSRLRVPYVVGGRPPRGVVAPYVDAANRHGAHMAADHLKSLGRRRIATITGPQDMTAGRDRLRGVRDALAGALAPEFIEEGDFTRRGGQAATVALLERCPDLDAIFAASDLMAIGAITALRDAGRRVPEDVCVVGFDDNELARAVSPALTTVRQDPRLQGRALVRMLLLRNRPDLELQQTDDVPDCRDCDHLVLPVELVVRDSA